jgi:SAM-dependent methyltransferase
VWLSKQQAKQIVRRTIGEPYVGKRLKQIRVAKILNEIDLNPASVLDAGTEDATFVYWLADRFGHATVTGIDINETAIEACQRARPVAYAGRVNFEARWFHDLPDEAFDLITVFDVFEHIEDDGSAARDLARALRPGGTLLAHVPRNRWRTFSGKIKTVPDSEAWKINPGHVRSGYSPDLMETLLESAGLHVVDVQTWLGRWGVLAHAVYERLEHPTPLRVLTIPLTVAAARFESRQTTPDGNTVFARAIKPST